MVPLLKDRVHDLSSRFNEDLMKIFLSKVCQTFSHLSNAFAILAI